MDVIQSRTVFIMHFLFQLNRGGLNDWDLFYNIVFKMFGIEYCKTQIE